MSYTAQAATIGREPVTIVEMDLDYCQLTYGVAPCAAVLGTTGAIKCFNTRKTCQDSTNYTPAVKTYRFSDKVLPVGAPVAIPSLQSVTILPSKIDPGKSLGQRATVTLTFKDHRLADYGIDKYISERTYDSGKQGTFWGKLIARNPYYQNRTLRVMRGYWSDHYDAANFQTRVYIIDSISGPDANDNVTVVAKDLLKLIDDQRAQAPTPNTGMLAADITDSATSATLSPAGIGDSEYPTSGYIAIGDEIMAFTRIGDALTLTRAQYDTDFASHSTGDAVQVCLIYTKQKIQDVIYDLLTNQSLIPIPTSYIDKVAWDAEAAIWVPDFIITALIMKSEGITKLVSELCQQGLIYIWWDEIAQKVAFKAIRPPRWNENVSIDETSNVVADSVSITAQPKDRISEVWVYFGPIDLGKNLDKASNYRNLQVEVDTDAESTAEYGEQRIMVIMSRWLPTDTTVPAQLLGQRLIAARRDNPRRIMVTLDAKDSALWTGGYAQLTSKRLQDPTGAAAPTNLQVLSVTEKQAGTTYQYELVDSFFQGRYGFITPNTEPSYSAATIAQKARYAWLAPTAVGFADGGLPYKII